MLVECKQGMFPVGESRFKKYEFFVPGTTQFRFLLRTIKAQNCILIYKIVEPRINLKPVCIAGAILFSNFFLWEVEIFRLEWLIECSRFYLCFIGQMLASGWLWICRT